MKSFNSGSLEICIAIPTLGKSPFLKRLLADLEIQVRTQESKAGAKIRLLVVDNYPSLNTRELVKSFELFNYVEEFTKGYASCRNRILECSQGCDFVVMVDDDMRLSDAWLRGVLDSISSGSAQIYSSNIFPANTEDIPSWLLGYFIRPVRSAGKTLPNFGSGNIIIDLKFVEKNSISFNPKYNQLGGEDVDFFNQITFYGGTANWVLSFPVYENYVNSQLTFAAVAKRESRTAKNFEVINLDFSIKHLTYLIARLVEVAVFDLTSFRRAMLMSSKWTSKVVTYFCHRTISFFKILARLSVYLERP
jgi:hypothetical protein